MLARKRHAPAAYPAQSLLAAIVESSNDAILSRALDGTINSWNKGAEKLFGYTAAEAIGQPFNFLVPPDGESSELQRLDAIREGRPVPLTETTRVTKAGKRIPIVLHVSPIYDDDGTVIGSSRIINDISDQLAADHANALLVAIVESSQDAIISKTLDGVITTWNTGAEHLFGWTAAEAIGRPIYMLIPEANHAQEDELLARLTRGERIEMSESIRLHKSGKEIGVSIALSPIRDRHGTIIGASKVARDISERQEMAKAQEQLRQSQKMESIGQLTGGIAHDFNNLLAVVLGNLDFMMERTTQDDPLREFIRPSIEAAEHGAELTQQLLSFGRKQALQPKIVNINELLHYFTMLVRHTLGERIQTILSLSRDVWNVNIDATQLQNALLNLAVNARDAMADGGKLIIETKNILIDQHYVDANAEIVAGDYVMIAVTDSGEGMMPDVLEKVFEPFFTTKEVGKGSGLGLSMVYGFVKQSAGYIKISSDYGHGTTVKIYLPRAPGESDLLVKHETNGIRLSEKKALILVVEDNKEVLKLTSTMVESLGYTILTAPTGDIALNLLKQHPDIALLLTDVMLPGALNGPGLAKHALLLNSRLKVIYNSGYAEHVIQQRGILEPGVNLIAKPFRKQQLAAKIAEVLQGP